MTTRKILVFMFLCLSACRSAPTEPSVTPESAPRAPQSSAPSARSPEEDAVAFLAKMLSNPQLPADLRKFNRQAVLLCWQNPAWNKISFKDEARKRASRIFLCNVPIQFRWCHTVKFLRIEGELKKGSISSAERESLQDGAFRECDQNRRDYLRTVYKWPASSGTLNSAMGGELDHLYRLLMRDRESDLDPSLSAALEQAHPTAVFGLSESELNGKLDAQAAVSLGIDSLYYGVLKRDIIELIGAMIQSALSSL